MGWFGVTIPLVAIPTAKFFGVNTPTISAVLILTWGLLHLATAYFGYEGMETLSFVAVPVLVVVGLLSIMIPVGDAGGVGALFEGSGTGETGFAAAITIVVGTFISGGTQTPNWARFAADSRVGFWAGLVAFLAGNGFLFLSGAVGGSVYDVTPADDLYEVLAGGAVGVALALVGAGSPLIPWLSTLGQYVPPLGGVIIADFLLCWRLSVPRMEDVRFTGVLSGHDIDRGADWL